MSSERNKQLAREFFACFTTGDIAGALDRMTDDATWWLPGKPGQLPIIGVQTKEEMARLFQAMTSQLENGRLPMTVKSIIAEGDQVALQAESHGQLRNGHVYNQEYHFALTFRDDKLAAVREYLDTQHVFASWFAP